MTRTNESSWLGCFTEGHIRQTRQVLKEYESTTVDGRATLPLSLHYIEMSRVSNVDRKVRLGTAMWHFSRGQTIIGYPAIVRHEFEAALKHPQIA